MTENLRKDNDYTISIVTESSSNVRSYNEYVMTKETSLVRTFNFLSAQIVTITRDSIYQPRGSEAGGAAAVASQTIIQNFRDIESGAEIEFMHAKLIEKGGHPPELPDYITGLKGKSGRPLSGGAP